MANELEKGIFNYVDRKVETASNGTKMTTGIIIGTVGLDGYTVRLNDQDYTNLLSLNGVTFADRDTVVVVMPNGNYNNMFILGKLG